ncbi:MAG TPA: sensor domain-containing diguanylate cyclase [Telluria sp.]|nr:sensor domain-containing diguanylate cyclase [Telluria sp.]
MDDASETLEVLQAENASLRARLSNLLEQAERNHEIMCRHQQFDLAIVGSSGFPDLVGTIFRVLPIISELDAVTLTLIDVDADIRTVMEKLGVDFALFPDLLFAQDADELFFPHDGTGLPTPILGHYDQAAHQRAFPAPPQGIASVALVPLMRNKRVIGSLNMASCDPARFTPALGTELVEHMASIIAICLENVISNEMLKYIGLTDSLTGVYNRRYMDRRLLEEIARARRQGYPVSCLYIDLDHFKHVNDTVGHQGGDEVLREVAGRIKDELRLSDALGRFGGEEFVALLIDADLEAAGHVAERIRAGVESSPVTLASAFKVRSTVSIGVATLEMHAADQAIDASAQHLVARADAALYRAKEAGRNRVIRFTEA